MLFFLVLGGGCIEWYGVVWLFGVGFCVFGDLWLGVFWVVVVSLFLVGLFMVLGFVGVVLVWGVVLLLGGGGFGCGVWFGFWFACSLLWLWGLTLSSILE